MILLLKLMLMLGTMAAATMTTPMMTSMTTPSSGPGLHAEEPAAQERRDRAMRAMTAEESDEEEEDLAHVRRAHEHNRSPAEHPGALHAAQLAAALPSEQKQMLGEKLFPTIYEIHLRLAGKITGMILQMDNSELLRMLESDQHLRIKVEEVLLVLEADWHVWQGEGTSEQTEV
jgi:hypothetical protein